MYQSRDFKTLLEIKRRRTADLERRVGEQRLEQSELERARDKIEQQLDSVRRSQEAASPLRHLSTGRQVDGKQLHEAMAEVQKLQAQAQNLARSGKETEHQLLLSARTLSRLEKQLASARKLVLRAEVTADHVHDLEKREIERRAENAAVMEEERRRCRLWSRE